MKPQHLTVASLAVAATLTLPAHGAGKALKFGHDNAPDPTDNPAHACTAVFANIVGADTNGEIEVEVFPSNQLGGAGEHLQMVRDGVIQASLISSGAMASFYPRIDVLNMPFAFDHNAATYDVFDGPFGKALAADIEAVLGDVKVLGFPDTGGFFAVTNSKQPITTTADFEGIRVRTMTLPSHQKIVQALGAEAYPLAWGEVYSGLQTGVIDGQMNPIPIIAFSKFSEVQKYLTLTNHLFSPYSLVVSKAFWDGLEESEQRTLRYAAESCVTASRGMARIIEASDRGLSGLQESMEVTALSDEERQKMKEATQPAFEEHVSENLDEKAGELLELFGDEVDKANAKPYMSD